MAFTNLGPFRARFKGNYNPKEKYRYMDVVDYTDGNSYVCINDDTIINAVDCIGIDPVGSTESNNYWNIYNRKGDKGDIADKYDSFLKLETDEWDYSKSDKVVVDEESDIENINITNVYDGCCGMLISRKNLNLPSNSDYSSDFYFIDVIYTHQYYMYTFVYIEVLDKFIWNRSVING